MLIWDKSIAAYVALDSGHMFYRTLPGQPGTAKFSVRHEARQNRHERRAAAAKARRSRSLRPAASNQVL
jgi:hypothetical protein